MKTEEPSRVVFNDAPSYLFYEQLKKDTDIEKYVGQYEVISELTKKYNWINDLFKKLSRNISLVHEKHPAKDEFGKKHCYDLNYWLHDEVFKKLQPNGNFRELKNIITNLQKVWESIVKKEFTGNDFKCLPDYNLYSDMGFLQEVKDLFDFFEDFGKMRKEIIYKTKESCPKYLDYLRQRIPIYYTWRDSCKDDNYTCKRYIDDYMKYRPSGMIISLGPLIYFTYRYNPCYVDVYNIFVQAKRLDLRNDGLYKHIMDELEAEELEQNLISPGVEDELGVNENINSGNNDNYLYRLMWDGMHFVYDFLIPYMILLLGIFLIFNILYKFTPLKRSFLRTRAKIRRWIGPNIGYEDIVILYGSDKSLVTNANGGAYNVTYSSK
ncbi:variable surface protein [Plasmodium gonderi]|uniref:Variable surface protein n=1 Tax=Plasmodium gonderi TaxID=77519 RepID=A0A1Y1JE49_PLAGO|nr:variable surface protein [Plasmodium gonderi]GAW79595.1 variable surface protein [Plasmodium gonderi]